MTRYLSLEATGYLAAGAVEKRRIIPRFQRDGSIVVPMPPLCGARVILSDGPTLSSPFVHGGFSGPPKPAPVPPCVLHRLPQIAVQHAPRVPMSDKSKRIAQDARIKQQFDGIAARDKAKGDARPRCLCGFTAEDKTIWVHEKKFWCACCLPLELLHMIRG